MTEEEAYVRYLKFRKIKFGALPRERWHLYFADLLEFEPYFVAGAGIGLVKDFPFRFEVTDARPIRQRPFPYAKEQREWLRQYMDKQCEIGVLRKVHRGKEPDPVFVQNIVLVKGGQTSQDYRACANLAEANTRIAHPAHPLPDCQSTVEGLQGSRYYSGLDVKAGFHNVPLEPEMQQYAGLVTQDGLYVA